MLRGIHLNEFPEPTPTWAPSAMRHPPTTHRPQTLLDLPLPYRFSTDDYPVPFRKLLRRQRRTKTLVCAPQLLHCTGPLTLANTSVRRPTSKTVQQARIPFSPKTTHHPTKLPITKPNQVSPFAQRQLPRHHLTYHSKPVPLFAAHPQIHALSTKTTPQRTLLLCAHRTLLRCCHTALTSVLTKHGRAARVAMTVIPADRSHAR